MRVKVCLTMVLVLAVAVPGAAQLVNETQFFPVVAHTAGAGDPPTSWRSDLTVHNVMDAQLTVGVMYFESGNLQPWDGTYDVTLVLQSRETQTVEDVVATLFGITANSKGSLLLECDEAQEVGRDKWQKDFDPMGASTNVTTVFFGTAS